MNVFAASIVFLLGGAGTIIALKRGGRLKYVALACAAVSLSALFYLAAAVILVGSIQ